MRLSNEEYARKRIHNGSSVQIENSVTRVTVWHHLASLVMPNSFPRDGIFNQHLTTIKDSYNVALWKFTGTSETIRDQISRFWGKRKALSPTFVENPEGAGFFGQSNSVLCILIPDFSTITSIFTEKPEGAGFFA